MFPLIALSLISGAAAQGVGSNTAESHPPLTWSRCTTAGCEEVAAEIVIDANWRWTHNGNSENCYDGATWTDICTSNEECASLCVLEGADYEGTYGISTTGDALNLKFVNEHAYGTNVGSRTYLLEDESTYQHFDLLGHEFTFDVDLSTVACGLNSALYFVPMPADGGVSSQPSNKAGAKYGTGYCDAQCARDLKFLGGVGNYEGWAPSSSDDQAGVGRLGSCCGEIDVWESNSHSFALTPHGCENNEYHICDAETEPGCGGTYSEERYAGLCDANGCDYNPYRMGNTDFYGVGKLVDTSAPFTVTTQWDEQGVSTQFFIQNGARIDLPTPTWEGLPATSNIGPELCDSLFSVFEEEVDRYADVGGWPAIQGALGLPQVLVMSIWSDHYANMLWLDGKWPRDAPDATPGAVRGDCPADSGVPAEVIAEHGDAYVTWSNIRYGPVGTTTEFS